VAKRVLKRLVDNNLIQGDNPPVLTTTF